MDDGRGRARDGADEPDGRVAAACRSLVPERLARRGVTVSVSTDRRRVPAGEPVPFTVRITNRLPVSTAVTTDTRRFWRWAVGDYTEGTDERVHVSGTGRLELGGWETRRVEREWNGLFGRTRGDRTRWEDPAPGRYELAVWLATDPPCARDSVTIEVHR